MLTGLRMSLGALERIRLERDEFNAHLGDVMLTGVTGYVEQILAGSRHGVRHQWLTFPKLVWRFVTAPFRQRNVVD